MNSRIKLYKNTTLANSSNGCRVGQNNRLFRLHYKTRKSSLNFPIIGIIVAALTTIVVKIIMYLLERRHIPKLDFDGLWKEP